MDTKELLYFRKIYEYRSMNKASRDLFMTPQGLSKVIGNLEQEVGAELFVRSRNGVRATPAGDLLYTKSNALMDLMGDIERSITQIARTNQMLRIGNSCGVLNVLPFWGVKDFESNNPDIKVYTEENLNKEIQKKVKNGDLDVGFVIGKTDSADLVQKHLVQKDICLFVYKGHPFFDRDSVSFQELKGEQIISLNEQFHCYKALYEGCMKYGFIPEISAKTMEHRVIMSFVRKRMGIGIDVSFADSDHDLKNIRTVPIQENPKWEVYLIYKKECENFPNIQRLVKNIKIT